MTVPVISLEIPSKRVQNVKSQKKGSPLVKHMQSLEISPNRKNDSWLSSLLKKIKNNPPSAEISDHFFKACIALACLSRKEYTKYEERVLHKLSVYESLTRYLLDNFTHEGGLQYSKLGCIGHLLMCGGIPNADSGHAQNYRRLLAGKSVFDPELMLDYLPMWLVKVVKRHNKKVTPEHANVCGFTMCQFMVYCNKGIALPDIDFIHSKTVSLTDEEKYSLMASKGKR